MLFKSESTVAESSAPEFNETMNVNKILPLCFCFLSSFVYLHKIEGTSSAIVWSDGKSYMLYLKTLRMESRWTNWFLAEVVHGSFSMKGKSNRLGTKWKHLYGWRKCHAGCVITPFVVPASLLLLASYCNDLKVVEHLPWIQRFDSDLIAKNDSSEESIGELLERKETRTLMDGAYIWRSS